MNANYFLEWITEVMGLPDSPATRTEALYMAGYFKTALKQKPITNKLLQDTYLKYVRSFGFEAKTSEHARQARTLANLLFEKMNVEIAA